MITSISLNRKTIDAVNLFHKLASLSAHSPTPFAINVREIKDKVNRSVDVALDVAELSKRTGMKKTMFAGGARNKKGF
jgi:hypothetical protein